MSYLYLMRDADNEHIKVGITGNPEARVAQLSENIREDSVFFYSDNPGETRWLEKEIHRLFDDHNTQEGHEGHAGFTEWFSIECLTDIENLLEREYPSVWETRATLGELRKGGTVRVKTYRKNREYALTSGDYTVAPREIWHQLTIYVAFKQPVFCLFAYPWTQGQKNDVTSIGFACPPCREAYPPMESIAYREIYNWFYAEETPFYVVPSHGATHNTLSREWIASVSAQWQETEERGE